MEMKINSLDIIIPVYNEGNNIKDTLDYLSINIRNIKKIKYTVYIVYDFDDDDTLPVIRRIRKDYNFKVVLLKNETGGVVNAIKKGFQTSKGDYILVTMADKSDDYEILPDMVKKARNGDDIICASRYMKGGRLIGGPFFKQLLSRIAGISLHFLTRIPTHDVTNSYKLYNREVIKKIKIESDGGFEIGLEILVKAYLLGYKIGEVPSRWWDRSEGVSKFKLFKWIPKYLKWYYFLIKELYSRKLKNIFYL